MVTPAFLGHALLVLLLAASSYAVAHGTRLQMRREGRLKGTAGVLFGFLAFLFSRLALSGSGWLVFALFFGDAPDPLIMLGLVGLASTPLLLSFVRMTPYLGPGILGVLHVTAHLRLTTLASSMLGMNWLGSLGWWTTAWVVELLASAALKWRFRSARWLAWTGVLGVARLSPGDVMARMPGMNDAIGEPTMQSIVPGGL